MVPATDSEVTNVFMTVRRTEPRFPNFAYGFLYATESARRRMVAIPYNYGVDKLGSINDLFVHAWVPRPSASSNVIDMAAGRVTVDRLPQSDVVFSHPYSIIYVPPFQPVTSGVNSCPALRATSDWIGNILVVKHGKRKPIINVDKEDSLLVDIIVSELLTQTVRNPFTLRISIFGSLEPGEHVPSRNRPYSESRLEIASPDSGTLYFREVVMEPFDTSGSPPILPWKTSYKRTQSVGKSLVILTLVPAETSASGSILQVSLCRFLTYGISTKMGGHRQKRNKVARQTVYDREGKRMRSRAAAVANHFFSIPELFMYQLLLHCSLGAVMVLARTS
ncbi:hypothetical protein B0H16DRAFT_1711222 [Mycena metata]|uniref:Uncharacterized protein n=1 Tax=Mycena metata TaxID=1033252 RepID=A0AAD7NY35_9AGAR|nr:hypothetical protein B0H16DRAFT_1711222 [Mycena metata]